MAQAYSGKPPVITDDIWYVWDAETDAYLSTGKPSRGEQGLTGQQGAAGPKGDTGEAAGFGVPVATVENSVGVPEVTVSASGPDTAKVFSFAFSGIKGETGAQGPQGAKGDPGAGVGSVVRTAGKGAAGTTDTYTMYNDEGEEIGSFEVYNGKDGKKIEDPLPNGNIIETVSGNVISVNNSMAVKPRELCLYGRSVQNGVPTLERPVDIQSMGNGEDIITTICGANLLDFSDAGGGEYAGVKTTLVGDGGYTITGTAEENNINVWFLGGYNLSNPVFSLHPGTYTLTNCILFNGKLAIGGQQSAYKPNIPITFTINEKTDVTGVRCVMLESGNTYNQTLYPMLNTGPIDLPWELYKSQILTYSTPNYLSGIPVNSSGNYINEDGQQWICDEVDFGRGKHIQRIGKIDHYTNEDVGDVYMSTTGQLSDGATVIYPLETPIETDLPEEVMDAYHQLTMYYPNTTITTDSYPPAGISVEYIADTKMYIDQKLDDLQKQLDILIGAET